MKEYNMSINDSIFTSLPFVVFSLRIYYFFIYKPNLLLKNMKFFSFQYLIRAFVLINMDNMPTVNARLKDERVKRWKGEKMAAPISLLTRQLVNFSTRQLVY